MQFDRGSITFAIFEVVGDIPENIVDLFAAAKAGPIDGITDEMETGWVSGRHLLDTQINGESADFGGSYSLILRQGVRKIPNALLTALCRREEVLKMKAENRERLPQKVKKEIREEVIEKNLQRMPPTLSGIPMLLEPHEKLLYVGASSQGKIDVFVESFSRATGLSLLQLNIAVLLERFSSHTASTFPTLGLTNEMDDDGMVARDFLMYLWYYSEEIGKLEVEDYGEFDIMLEAPLIFTGDSDGCGSGEASIKKGSCPLRSAEAKAALTVGKKLKKAKITITRDNQIWTGNFDADNFIFSSFKLPESTESNPYERNADRVTCLSIFKEAITGYFKKFVDAMSDENVSKTRADFAKWARERDAV